MNPLVAYFFLGFATCCVFQIALELLGKCIKKFKEKVNEQSHKETDKDGN